ncbi:MAG: heat shock protein 15 [Verrucomicrobiaceae bacterium]|nr:heat shock protein 15 [Verrucomicrobiaceae bacterium]
MFTNRCRGELFRPVTSIAEPLITQRVDKWLHHVRIFKTRTLATQACNRSNVKVDHDALKPSRELKGGETLHIERGDLKLIIKVIAFPEVRIGPPLVPQFYENLTPPENYVRASEARKERAMITPRPHDLLTRPTKKDLREIRKLMGKD